MDVTSIRKEGEDPKDRISYIYNFPTVVNVIHSSVNYDMNPSHRLHNCDDEREDKTRCKSK